jgi:cystathionine beta-lyase family protein involved in aluminum resistance
MQFTTKLEQIRREALLAIRPRLESIEEISTVNTAKTLAAFRKHRVSAHMFNFSTGYAYDDVGRDTLELVWADICGSEKALFRTQFCSGTHALASVLFGVLRPGDELVSAAGAPYDTMQSIIGAKRRTPGSLCDWGISYREIPLLAGAVDEENLIASISDQTKMVLIQRSRGYSLRAPLMIADIERLCMRIKAVKPDCICFVDNCYGEFVETREPTEAGADIMAGSLIKNPGGGIAPTGGYVAGKADLVELAAYRLTAPGIGSEVGSSLGASRLLYQGLFMAPHIVAQAVKGAVFAAKFFALLGYETSPQVDEARTDIIQAIKLNTPDNMVAFCRGLQKHSPVDSHVRPVPSGMPGYDDAVVMAGGTFVQGSSIEMSADGPLRPPYAVYLQGALSFEHAVLGIMGAASELPDSD